MGIEKYGCRVPLIICCFPAVISLFFAVVPGHKQEQNQRFEHENAQKQRGDGAPADGSTSLARKLRLEVLVFERGLGQPGAQRPVMLGCRQGADLCSVIPVNTPPGPAAISAAPGYPRLRSPPDPPCFAASERAMRCRPTYKQTSGEGCSFDRAARPSPPAVPCASAASGAVRYTAAST